MTADHEARDDSRRCWCSPTARRSRARRSARRPTIATGEVVFNTVLSGYQEVITDPSYAGQIITFTYPHIGNYGVTPLDDESRRPFCRGVIVRDFDDRPSSWRATRASTRSSSAMASRASPVSTPVASLATSARRARCRARSAPRPRRSCCAAAKSEPGTDGVDLVATVTCAEPYVVGNGPCRVVAYDFGIKATILRHLGEFATVEVVPASTPASEVLARKPDGVFLSNGPGDPAVVVGATDNIGRLLGEVPVFGICLGHQLLGHDARCRAFKLPFGHHGGNHPVRAPRDGSDRDHEPEPQLRRRRRRASRCRRHAREPQRRDRRGTPLSRRARVQRAVPPGGRSRAARRALPLRSSSSG